MLKTPTFFLTPAAAPPLVNDLLLSDEVLMEEFHHLGSIFMFTVICEGSHIVRVDA